MQDDFGQSMNGPCVELHTLDQSVRLLTSNKSQEKEIRAMFLHALLRLSCLIHMYASVAFSDMHSFSAVHARGGGLPPPSPEAELFSDFKTSLSRSDLAVLPHA